MLSREYDRVVLLMPEVPQIISNVVEFRLDLFGNEPETRSSLGQADRIGTAVDEWRSQPFLQCLGCVSYMFLLADTRDTEHVAG